LLKIGVPNHVAETLLPWLTRAALEVHLQGVFALILDNIPRYCNGVNTQPCLGLPLRWAILPNVVGPSELSLEHTKDLCERVMPKLDNIMANFTFAEDALEWLRIERPIMAEYYDQYTISQIFS